MSLEFRRKVYAADTIAKASWQDEISKVRVLTERRVKDGALPREGATKRGDALTSGAISCKARGRDFSTGRREAICQAASTI